jgi:lysophospholipase L1-like esterase
MQVAVFFALAAACSSPAASAPTPRATPSATIERTPSPTPSPSPAGGVRYVAIGASDSVGVGATDPARGSWPARIRALLPSDATYLNLGVSGSLTEQARTQQLPGAIAQRPTVVTIWLAVNDLNATVDPASYAQALAAIVDGLVQGTQATIFIGNVPDLRAVPVYASVDKARLFAGINAYNDAIARIATRAAGRVVLVDLFTGSAELVSTATVASDGFHPSDGGYQLIADRFAAAMRTKGLPLRS